MQEIIEGAGIFIYPLGLCSLLGAAVICERLFSLLRFRVCPPSLVNAVVKGGEPPKGANRSVLGRILGFSASEPEENATVKAVARVEVNRLERGLVLLEIITAAAPLLGLLGTVTGLIQVFGNLSPETGLPEPEAFVQGVALALTTTVIGLAIAIPCLVAHAYFQRKVETYAVTIDSLIDLQRGRSPQER